MPISQQDKETFWSTTPQPVPKHSKSNEAIPIGLVLLIVFTATYLLENPARRAAIGNSLKRRVSRLDGPHRAFLVLAAVWLILGPYFVPARQRSTVIRSWIGWTLSDFIPRGDTAQTLAFVGLPAVVLYVTAFLLAPPIFRWVRAGFTKDQDSPNP